MTTVLKVAAMALVGAMLGLLFTIYTLDPMRRGVTAGPWRGSPQIGTPDIDPYALATIARVGLLPLGPAEGVSFEAARDSAGAILTPACDYEVVGPMPPARFWSLSVLTRDGYPIDNIARRYAFTSAEILRQNQDPATIAISTRPQSGNWLPIGHDVPFVLALRLYDTGLSAIETRTEVRAMPLVRAIRCRS